MISWVLILALGIVIGLALGVYLMRLDDEAKRTQQDLQQQLEQSKTDMQLYKAEVQSSYVTTAHLINNLTDSYKAVHQHLSHSAAHLCGDVAAVNKLDIKESTLAQIEQSPSSQVATAAATSQAPASASLPASEPTKSAPVAADTEQADNTFSRTEREGNDVDNSNLANFDSNSPNVETKSAHSEVNSTHSDLKSTQSEGQGSDGVAKVQRDEKQLDDQTSPPASAAPATNDDLKAANTSAAATVSASAASDATKDGTTKLTPEEDEALQERLKLEQARVEASRMIH